MWPWPRWSRTIAFPAISCGAYGYPVPDAARISAETTREFLSENEQMKKVIFVLSGDEIYDAYRQFV